MQEERLAAYNKTLKETEDILIRTKIKYRRQKNESTKKTIKRLKKDIAEQKAIIVNEASEQCTTTLIRKQSAQKIKELVKQGVI